MNPIRWRFEEFDTIDSTNTWLKALGVKGEPEGLVARADFQSAGRGRLDRSWEAPKGSSLLSSILLRPTIDDNSLFLITVAVALSARSALVRLCGVRPQLKWPNDLIVKDAKLGGILAESFVDVNGASGVVVGLGLNLNWPGPSGAASTCVKELAGVTLAPQAVLDLLIEELDLRLGSLYLGDPEPLRTELHSALATIGRRVRVERPRDVVEGVAIGIDHRGRLEIDVGTRTELIEVGDITHLRDAEDAPL